MILKHVKLFNQRRIFDIYSCEQSEKLIFYLEFLKIQIILYMGSQISKNMLLQIKKSEEENKNKTKSDKKIFTNTQNEEFNNIID